MTKIDLQQIGFTDSTSTLINSNSSVIEVESDFFLSRDGTAPNEMLADLDMNSNSILNLPAPSGATEPLRLTDLASFIGGSITLPAPGGATTQVQFNNAGSFGGDAGLTYNTATDTLFVNGLITVGDANFALNFNAGTAPFLRVDSGDLIAYDRSANIFLFQIASSNVVGVSSNLIFPVINDGVSLGSGALGFSDLFLAAGAVIGFNNSALTITHSTAALSMAASAAGGNVIFGISNTANSGGNSHVRLDLINGGSSGGDVMVNFSLSGETSWQVGAKNSDNSLRISNNAAVGLGTSDRLTIDANGNAIHSSTATAAGTQIFNAVDGNARGIFVFAGADGTTFNAANCCLGVRSTTGTGRSINASGTINASGADYAEYEYKRDDCGPMEKGSVIGFDREGFITDKWSLATTFGVKSTKPGYVGGDDWKGSREHVDRVAYSGKTPVNVLGTQPGDFIDAALDGDDNIIGIVSATPGIKTVGCVRRLLPDGRALIKVM